MSITGFGHDGPEGGRAGYDQIAQGEAGLMSVTGEPGHPTRVGVPIADLLAGMYGAYGLVAALLERERTGVGRVVRTSLLASVVGVHAFQGTMWTVAGEVPVAQGNHHPRSRRTACSAADGDLQLSVGSERQWRLFAPLVRIDPDDPRFRNNTNRVGHRDALIAEIESTLAEASTATWLRLVERGSPRARCDPRRGLCVGADPVARTRLIQVDHPVLGPSSCRVRRFDSTARLP